MQKEALDKKVEGIISQVHDMFIRDGVVRPRLIVITNAGHTTVFDIANMDFLENDTGAIGQSVIALCRPIRHALAVSIFVAEASRALMPHDPADRKAMLDKIKAGELDKVARVDCLVAVANYHAGDATTVYTWPIEVSDGVNVLGALEQMTQDGGERQLNGRLSGLFADEIDSDVCARLKRSVNDVLKAYAKPGVPLALTRGIRIMVAKSMHIM